MKDNRCTFRREVSELRTMGILRNMFLRHRSYLLDGKNLRHSGFTMIEMMTVIVVAGILVASGIFVLTRTGEHYRMRSTAMMLRQEMALSRQLAKEKGRAYGFVFGNDKWHRVYLSQSGDTVLESTTELPGDLSFGVQSGVNKRVDGSANPPASGIDFPDGAVFFFKRGATPGELYITSGRETKAIEVNSLGNPRVYDWDGYNWKKQN